MTPRLKLFKEIDCIREKDEIIFLSAIDSLFRNGYSNYTAETVKQQIQYIVNEVKNDKENNILSNLITPEYRISIIETAYELRKYKLWELLTYIQKSVNPKSIEYPVVR